LEDLGWQRSKTHITKISQTIMDTRREIAMPITASGKEVRRLASVAILEDLEMEAVDEGRGTSISEGIGVESGVVLAHCGRAGCKCDGSVSDGADGGKDESDGTKGEHGGGRHRRR
jgi:hypothetical protein